MKVADGFTFRLTPEEYQICLLVAVVLSGILNRLFGLFSVIELADMALYGALTLAAVGRIRDLGVTGWWALLLWLPVGIWLLPLAASWRPTWHSNAIIVLAACAALIHFVLALCRSNLLRSVK